MSTEVTIQHINAIRDLLVTFLPIYEGDIWHGSPKEISQMVAFLDDLIDRQ